MNKRKMTLRFLYKPLIALAALAWVLIPLVGKAASGTWTNTASGGLWSDAANWTNAIVADGSGNTANLGTIDITIDPTVVHLDTTRTIGSLTFGDTTTSSAASWFLDNNGIGANVLTLAGGTPTITVNTLGSGKNATISGAIDGTAGLVKAGAGALFLTGTNIYTGPTVVNGASLTFIGNQDGVTGGFYVGTNTAAVTLNIGTSSQAVPTTMNIASGSVVKTASAGTSYSTINANGASDFPTFVTNNGSLFTGRDSGFAVGANANWLQHGNMMITGNGGYPANWTLSSGGAFTYDGSGPIVIAPGSSGNGTLTINGDFTTSQGFDFTNTGTTGKAQLVLGNGGAGVLNLSAQVDQLIITNGSPGTNPYAFLIGNNATINIAGYNVTNFVPINDASGQAGALTVNGGGTFTLTGISTYTGGTTVSNNTTLVLAKGSATGAIRNNLNIQSGAVVVLAAQDAMGYNAGVCVTNVNIYGGMLTNAGAGFFQAPLTYYNLSGGTVASAGGPFTFSGRGIASLSNSVLSVFSAPVRFGANSALTLSAASGTVPGGVDLSITGNIYQGGGVSGSSVIKTGAGVVQLNGANSYDGSTTINAGTLALGATATLPNTTNILVAAGATFDVSAISGFTLGYNQGISGSGTINGSVADSGGSQFSPGGFNAVGTLTITTNLTLAGSDTLNFDFSAGGSNDVINVGGTLTPNYSTAINLANWPVGGFQNGNYVLVQAATLGGDASYFYLQNVPTGGRQSFSLVYDTGSSPQKILLQVSGVNANLVWQGGSGNYWDVQYSQDWLNGGVSDYFYTSDNVLFSNVPPANASVNINAYNIQPGSVTFNSTNNYVFSGGFITGTAGLTKNGTGSVVLPMANDYSGGTTINGGTLQLGDGVAYNGSVAGAIANNASLVVSNASSQTLNNNISGFGQTIASGALDLTLSGNISGAQQVVGNAASGLTLSGTNSYTGGTVVSNGLLIVAKTTALGSPASGILATVNGGATLAYHVSGTQTLTNPFVGAGALAYSNATPGSLGNGLAGLKLAVSNGFSGGLTINVGSVYAYDNHALGSGPVTIDNGNLNSSYYNQLFVGNGLNISNAITIVNASDFFDGVLMVDPGPNNSYGASDTNGGTFSGPITVAAGATIQHGGLFCGPGQGTNWLVIAGPVTNLNAGGSVSSRNGRTRFSGGGAYDIFTVSGGTAQIGANNGVCPSATLQISGGSFDLNGYSQTFGGLSNPGAGSINNSSTNHAGTLTLNLSTSSTYSSVLSGNLNLVLNGSSLLNLTGTNTYKGNTTVNGGTLEIAVASLATNSAVTIANGAFLQLDFTVTNQVGSLALGGVTQAPGVYNYGTSPSFFTASSQGSLVVVSTVASYPTNITASVSGSNLTLSWPATHLGWYAQSNSVSLANTNYWFDIPGSQVGTNLVINMNPAKTNVFYRLRMP